MTDDGREPVTGTTEPLRRPPAIAGGVRLVVVEGPDAGTELLLEEGAATVGKSSRADLTLADDAVSALHLRVEVTGSGLCVTDLESTNGTLYLQTDLDQATLVHGAVLTLGRTRLALASPRPAGSPGVSAREAYGDLVGSTPPMRRLYATLERLERVEDRVLILGETGVGKEVVARAVHLHSTRCDAPFLVFDCGAVSPALVASELFGHVRGAFTGADSARAGVFERAEGGIVFLDEIGELPLELQPSLLRVLESGEIRRVGGSEPMAVDVRVIAATHRDLEAEVEAGRFRQDLFYRLNVVTVRVPPLRERREDIPALVRALLDRAGQTEVSLSADTLELFTTGYEWPGNVRELQNVMARVLVLGEVPDALAAAQAAPASVAAAVADAEFPEAKRRVMDAFEREYLTAQLERADGNLSEAARRSGLDRSYFKRLLKRHGLRPERSGDG